MKERTVVVQNNESHRNTIGLKRVLHQRKCNHKNPSYSLLWIGTSKNMEELKLIQSEEQPKKKTWLQERIDDFLDGFKQATGKKCPMPYQALVGMLYTKAHNGLGGWATVSEDGKEIVPWYPDMDVWIEQREAFFKDEFAATKSGFSFQYFLKQFGTFQKFTPMQETPKNIYKCEYCGQTMRPQAREGHKWSCVKYPKELLY